MPQSSPELRIPPNATQPQTGSLRGASLAQGGGVLHPSPIEYAQCGQAYVAYRTCGDGPMGLVLISDWFGHVDEMWSPASPLRPVLEQLASFSRLVTFDQRGVGLSD